MTSRPRSQENVCKSKLPNPLDLRCRRGSTSSSTKPADKSVAEISMKDFLDFLKISYQVNEAVEGDIAEIGEKLNLDWKRLTGNKVINDLKEKEKLDAAASAEDENATAPSNASDEPRDSKARDKTDAYSGDSQNVPLKSCQSCSEETLSDNAVLDDGARSEEQCRGSERRERKGRKGRSASGRGSVSGQEDSDADRAGESGSAEKILKKKLNEVLQEGILDSVLPYLLPKHDQQTTSLLQPPIKKLLLSNEVKKSAAALLEKTEKNGLSGAQGREKKESKTKSYSSGDSQKHGRGEKDTEVVIHVCDEINNLKRDFKCSQRLLVSEMGYFAEVTNGQRLEEMDISVHCDVSIFDWLMKWIHRDRSYEDSWPRLDPAVAVPVLLSSAFLQMNTLQDHCLQYCKYNINDILRDSPSLNCINDSILTRLAAMFSNSDVEKLKDKKDKLQSRLYCKLIMSLTDPQPQPHRGHYSTVATMYRCSKCSKLILRNISSSILCVPSCMVMDRNGFVMSTHVRDPSWSLTDYVRSLKSDLKAWKKVYWRLWSDCHLLFCHTCSSYFPVHQMYWCRYHLETAQFYVKDNQRSVGHPVGRYPCCGERAYRFETLKNKLGCQYREHTIDPKSGMELEIYRLWNEHRDLIRADPPPIEPSERVRHYSKLRDEGCEKKTPPKDGFWWEGLQLVPAGTRSGLLSSIWDKISKKEESKPKPDSRESRTPSIKKSGPSSPGYELSTSSESSDQQSSASDAGDSEDSGPMTARASSKTRAPQATAQSVAAARNEGSQFWLPKLSTRCNQDNQREFEERAFRQIESILTRKISGETLTASTSRTNCQSAATPPGGIYVKLEQEWREAHCNLHGCPASAVKGKASSGSHGNSVPNSNSNSSTGRLLRAKSHRRRKKSPRPMATEKVPDVVEDLYFSSTFPKPRFRFGSSR